MEKGAAVHVDVPVHHPHARRGGYHILADIYVARGVAPRVPRGHGGHIRAGPALEVGLQGAQPQDRSRHGAAGPVPSELDGAVVRGCRLAGSILYVSSTGRA
jgi:hypothetical protein